MHDYQYIVGKVNKINKREDVIFKALGDEIRLKIVELLSGGELCACVILEEFSIKQPTLSHHMKILCESEIVGVRKMGKWNYYFLNTKTIDHLRYFLAKIGELKKENNDKNKECTKV